MQVLPNMSINVYQVIQRVEQVTVELHRIAKEENLDLMELTKIWVALPIDESGGMTYLEAASQCIIDVSNLVDTVYPNMVNNERTAKKFRLMSKLLALKANQLILNV